MNRSGSRIHWSVWTNAGCRGPGGSSAVTEVPDWGERGAARRSFVKAIAAHQCDRLGGPTSPRSSHRQRPPRRARHAGRYLPVLACVAGARGSWLARPARPSWSRARSLGHWSRPLPPPHGPEPARYGVSAPEEHAVTMSDGVRIRADVYYPTDPRTGQPAAGSFPAILAQTPY